MSRKQRRKERIGRKGKRNQSKGGEKYTNDKENTNEGQ